MKTDGEKLSELMNEAHAKCDSINCIGGEECEYDGTSYCFEHLFIDYIISQGVTIPVRCRECRYLESDDWNGETLYCCTNTMIQGDVTPEAFCSYGERKEE